MIAGLPDHLLNASGETLFIGLIKVESGGRLFLLVPFGDGDGDGEWLTATVDCPAGRDFAAELDAHALGAEHE